VTLRLLISARDTGAAQHLAEVARRAAQAPDIELTVAASMPALGVLRALPGVQVIPFEFAAIGERAQAGPLLQGARELLAEVRPDAVLVGLSGPGAGLDEALIASADGIPTFVFQDFWGDLNTLLGAPEVTVLAMDDQAARITRQRHGLDAAVVGAPAYERFANLDVAALAEDARSTLAHAPPLLTVCGQPLWEAGGYARTLDAIGRAAPQAGLQVIAWRPHPKESREQQAAAAELLAASGAAVLDARSLSLESLLAASDVLCSAFSNCAADLVQLGRVAPRPLGSAVFALFDPELLALYRRWTGLDDLPLSGLGVAQTVQQPRDLVTTLRRAVGSRARTEAWERAREAIPYPGGAAERVLQAIRDTLERTP